MTQATVDIDVIKRAVYLACRAPSLHNSQPWGWVADGDALHLFSDAAQIGRSTDHTGREVIISCGAVLDHLRVAMTAAGWHSTVERFPNPNDATHLAALYFSPMEFVTDGQRLRVEAIRRRRTDRLPFAPPPHWESFEPLLRNVVDPDLATLHVIPDGSRSQLAEASRLTEALRRDDSSYHAELQWWTSHLDSLQGIPITSRLSESENERLDVSRHFPAVGSSSRRTEIAKDRSKVVVLSTYDDSRRCALASGEVLSAVLLECTMSRLATNTLTHMIEVTAARQIVRMLTDKYRNPQVLIRIGKAPDYEFPPPSTARRPLTDVFQVGE